MIKEAIQALVSGHSLTVEEAASVMEEIIWLGIGGLTRNVVTALDFTKCT